ncbi:hypothetical protein PTSG_11429 [Salpingoeca rosetta]|uniref:Uncharacterized protein n=1 Tax=Salpingoeca rosetta (strain ATCC 50818 / BSB-021) TaxID=946362 RepID=F2UTE3_SALR5|nr:uncharacterized protein PTSG_11429 [Salpingoeca rosetta]EGD82825.1 hypothetical protein PTSG_11429 [Salpingoeca rosetta]|eukprot:XP_004987563.1 hypothetical protein PTSG_11429 [Salpingoeca rosetta]
MQMSGISEHVIYDVKQRVTLRAKASAIVPVQEYAITGKRVVVYDRKINEVNAMRAFHIENTTDDVLCNGTVSILEGGRFAGQVEFAPMLPKDDQIIRYGLDTSVSVTATVGKKDEAISDMKLATVPSGLRKTETVRGLEITYLCRRETTYTLKNNSTEALPKTVYVDHTASNADNGYSVITTDNCVKASTGFSRFAFHLKPQEEVVFKVQEEATYSRTIRHGFDKYIASNDTQFYKEKHLLTDAMVQRLLEVRGIGTIEDAVDVSAAARCSPSEPLDKFDKQLDKVVADVPASLKDTAQACFSAELRDGLRNMTYGMTSSDWFLPAHSTTSAMASFTSLCTSTSPWCIISSPPTTFGLRSNPRDPQSTNIPRVRI